VGEFSGVKMVTRQGVCKDGDVLVKMRVRGCEGVTMCV
jgi:hypothetical protein